jgi:hypothetical protein
LLQTIVPPVALVGAYFFAAVDRLHLPGGGGVGAGRRGARRIGEPAGLRARRVSGVRGAA